MPRRRVIIGQLPPIGFVTSDEARSNCGSVADGLYAAAEVRKRAEP
jgi:hypothetical protein